MRKIFWAIVLFGAYIWIVTSGRDEMVLNHGKTIWKAVTVWFEDAEIDFQWKNEKEKKRSRRWD